jgi:tetratricopeptide (TPR) repeat protein
MTEAQACGDLWASGTAIHALVFSYIGAENGAVAEDWARKFLGASTGAAGNVSAGMARALVAEALLAQGQIDAADQLFAIAVPELRKTGFIVNLGRALVLWAQTLTDLPQRTEQAAELLVQADEVAKLHGLTGVATRRLYVQGRRFAAIGDMAQARSTLLDAVTQGEHSGYRFHAQQAARVLGIVEHLDGDIARALEWYERSRGAWAHALARLARHDLGREVGPEGPSHQDPDLAQAIAALNARVSGQRPTPPEGPRWFSRVTANLLGRGLHAPST